MLIIDRLRVRGKLNLLLLLPLIAVVFVAVPFLAGQIQNAGSAKTTADSARTTRQLGTLIWELQRERLITAGYLADRDAEPTTMLLQQQAVEDSAESVRRSLGSNASDELSGALVRLGSLAELRQSARHRGAPLDSVARAYHAVIDALIDALRLVPQRTSDAEGTQQLTALDSMLRAHEESALRGMALIAAAVNPSAGGELLTHASAQTQMFTERFAQQADVDQAALVVLVDQGETARRIDDLAQHLPDPRDPDAVQTFARRALAGAEAQAGLRRLAQDRVSSQITDAAVGRADVASTTAWTVGVGTAVLFALVIALAVIISRSIAHPLQRLTRAAKVVTDLTNAELMRVTDAEQRDEQSPRLTAIDVLSSDEVGELAGAFNQVQATAALLLERQVVTRRNVSLMFANVARRTQNLVRRQLILIDELERDEQDTRLLSELYRLDHLSNRLRRNAENLLVVAGAKDENRIAAPAPLAMVLRSALAEIEDYRRVNLHTLHEGTVAGPLVSDLVLVFAELLENATACSPPDSTVDVRTTLSDDGWCQVSIVDHGIGMAPQRLAEENRRLVERERLDIAPTSVLGLFVVGRLARRHGLAVELVPTPGQGITATVAIPPSLYSPGTAAARSVPEQVPFAPSRRPAISPPRTAAATAPIVPGSSSRSATETAQPQTAARDAAAECVEASPTVSAGEAPAAVGAEERRESLKRRVPGAQLPVPEPPSPDQSTAGHVHDASALRTAMDGLQSGFARAADSPGASTHSAPPVRRTPGASLPPGLRHSPPSTPARRVTAAPQRDPDAERMAYDGFATAWAEAKEEPDSEQP
ncbi:nitrate- and nitrite sensing domain-containing protein [Streptomyces sp. KR80]|uniref:nitrate- and nitrite sensing domain-containing protein n=1 Tax=Streptomyces sp. KR80 TaxID=3457426 RepID=UPI003FCF1659